MKRFALACVFAAAACFSTVARAQAKIESLGKPCHAFNVLASRVVIDPAGKEWFVLCNTNETSGVELLFINFRTNIGKAFRAPAGQGAWALNVVPDDRLIIGTYYDGRMMVFDLKAMQFTKVIPFPGEEYFWNAAIGSDGRLYGGTYPHAKLGALDLSTYALEDCGAPAPPNLYLHNVSALPDGRILCNFVATKPATRIFDPATKKWSEPPDGFKQVERGVTYNGIFLGGSAWDGGKKSGAIAFDGKTLQPIDPPPFPLPPKERGDVTVDLQLTTPQTLYLRQGTAIWRIDSAPSPRTRGEGGGEGRAAPEDQTAPTSASTSPAPLPNPLPGVPGRGSLVKIFDQDLKSGAITAVASDGTLLGIRGQDYVIAAPGELQGKLMPIPVVSGPRPPHFIRYDGKRKLWGGPMFGQTLFSLDPATPDGFVSNTGIICNAGGEVYDVAFLNSKVYAVAYAGGDIVEYDPAQPWDQLGNKNPRTLVHLSDRGYIRPVAGALVGPDQKIYSGWMARYGTYGGAIAITDPAGGETRLFENPLGAQAISALALDDQFIYAGTALHANGLPNKPGEEASFGVIDRASGKVLFQQPLPGGEVGKILLDARTRRVAVLAERKIHLFDPATRRFSDAPAELPPVIGRGFDGRGDGRIFYTGEKQIIRFDISTGKIDRYDAPAKLETLCIGGENEIFFACGPEIFRLTIQDKPSE